LISDRSVIRPFLSLISVSGNENGAAAILCDLNYTTIRG
jgi:hypothetical protein